MNIYLVGFSHEAGRGTPGYIRINPFGPRFMVPLLTSTLPEDPPAALVLREGWDGWGGRRRASPTLFP